MKKTTESTSNVEDSNAQGDFLSAVDDFLEAAPSFREIEDVLSKINTELGHFSDDFDILFKQRPEWGGGIEGNEGRIDNMRNSLEDLGALVESAESILSSSEDYSPFRKQVEAARVAYSKLHLAMATLPQAV